MKYLLLAIVLSSCTVVVKVQDDQINKQALVKEIYELNLADKLIVEKLKELMDKGYLSKPEAKKE